MDDEEETYDYDFLILFFLLLNPYVIADKEDMDLGPEFFDIVEKSKSVLPLQKMHKLFSNAKVSMGIAIKFCRRDGRDANGYLKIMLCW